MSAVAAPRAQRATDVLSQSLQSCLVPGDGMMPPVAVLWTDGDGQWADLVVQLSRELPQFFTLGDYDPTRRTGPAIWLRCVVDRTLSDVWPADAKVPVIYLPRVERQELRAGGDCPPELQPLVELQYRGTVWHQRNGRDWTVEAFLTSAEGCGLEIAKDQATRAALMRVLPRVADVPLDALRGHRLTADDFDRLAVPDAQRDLLLWMHDPSSFQETRTPAEWRAFCNLVRNRFGFDPEDDGLTAAARRLLEGEGNWTHLWQRFEEAPQRYRGISKLLREPLDGQGILVDPSKLPLENEEQEKKLREALARVPTMSRADAYEWVRSLEVDHGARRTWVWRYLEESPYAEVLQPLSQLAELAAKGLAGGTVADIATTYATVGWRCDDAALEAMTVARGVAHQELVCDILRVLYLPWLEDVARQFQHALAQSGGVLPTTSTSPVEPGTCLLFADGLRFDLAARLHAELESQGFIGRLSHRIGPMPTVTATAKPLASILVDAIEGADSTDFTPRFKDTKQPVTATRMRDRLAARHVEVLDSDSMAAPSSDGALGWIEVGRIDELGHKLGEDLPKHLAHEVIRLRDTVVSLLAAGWHRVRVVTDHGWLLMPGGLPKIELPHYLAASRWARCASVRAGATPSIATSPWYWNPEVRIASPAGAGAYIAGTTFTHGGVSPQECVVPDLTFEASATTLPAKITAVEWKRLRCVVTVSSTDKTVLVDVRSNWKQPNTSLVITPKTVGDDGSVSLAVRDEFEGQSVMVVVMDVNGAIVDKRSTTVGGD